MNLWDGGQTGGGKQELLDKQHDDQEKNRMGVLTSGLDEGIRAKRQESDQEVKHENTRTREE